MSRAVHVLGPHLLDVMRDLEELFWEGCTPLSWKPYPFFVPLSFP